MSANRVDLQALALLAFVYGYPLYEMARVRAATSPRRIAPQGYAGDGPDSSQRWCNSFVHARKLLGAGSSPVVTPNNDTLYSNAWLDLDESPLVIDVPDTAGRYYVPGLLDFYTNPFAHIGSRLTGTAARSFLITGPNWQGELPAEFSAPGAHVRSPTRWVWIIGRVLVDAEHELPLVHVLQDGFLLRTLAAWQAGAPATPSRFEPGFDPSAQMTATHSASQVNQALRDNPAPSDMADTLRGFAAVGIGAGCPDETDAAQTQLLEQAISAGLQQLRQAGLGGREHLGWSYPALIEGGFGRDHLRRATVALKYIGMLESGEATYPMAYLDTETRPLSGQQAYRLRFAPGQLPPVDGFWLLTMYDGADFMLMPNAISRFAIGDRRPGLLPDADGGLTLCLSRQAPPET